MFDDLRGDPHVYWAGNTPAGQAAVVVQQAYLHPHEQLPPGAADTLRTLVGLVGDVINRNVPLPVRYRLPDGQGWLVAAYGKALSYRTDGDWHDVGRDAALLPDNATQVRVGDQVVDLPR